MVIKKKRHSLVDFDCKQQHVHQVGKVYTNLHKRPNNTTFCKSEEGRLVKDVLGIFPGSLVNKPLESSYPNLTNTSLGITALSKCKGENEFQLKFMQSRIDVMADSPSNLGILAEPLLIRQEVSITELAYLRFGGSRLIVGS